MPSRRKTAWKWIRPRRWNSATLAYDSRRDRLAEAMVTLGDYAVGDEAAAKNRLRLSVTAQLARSVLRVRMLGSAAIDLAWLAEGKTDACIILSNQPWDTAAGVVIAAEAGAQVVDLDGSPHTMRSKATIGAPPGLIAEILDLMHRARTLDTPDPLCD